MLDFERVQRVDGEISYGSEDFHRTKDVEKLESGKDKLYTVNGVCLRLLEEDLRILWRLYAWYLAPA
jgi:hypothetical protein